MGLKLAWALDLTTADEEGKPWGFSRADPRRKALRMLIEDKPLMLVACPMCGPLSTMNELNYAHMSEGEIKERLHGAMLHMKFALTPCLQQYMAGRLFLFDHPAGASSWSTKMMFDMLSREGLVFCKIIFSSARNGSQQGKLQKWQRKEADGRDDKFEALRRDVEVRAVRQVAQSCAACERQGQAM